MQPPIPQNMDTKHGKMGNQNLMTYLWRNMNRERMAINNEPVVGRTVQKFQQQLNRLLQKGYKLQNDSFEKNNEMCVLISIVYILRLGNISLKG